MPHSQPRQHLLRLGKHRPSIIGIHCRCRIRESIGIRGGIERSDSVVTNDLVHRAGASTATTTLLGEVSHSQQGIGDGNVGRRGGFLLDECYRNVSWTLNFAGVGDVVTSTFVFGSSRGLCKNFQKCALSTAISSYQSYPSSTGQNVASFLQLVSISTIKGTCDITNSNRRRPRETRGRSLFIDIGGGGPQRNNNSSSVRGSCRSTADSAVYLEACSIVEQQLQ
mmetsp:Transcript_3611/g.7968  ORF Transcript_3611/g.7968 Transcript_3611/m.7968 type:complete len:224 (-) Transcript_3611:128-799(-)